MPEELHGRIVVRIGNRCFAVRKDLSTADKIHMRTQLGGAWDRQMTIPKARCIKTRSIKA